MIFALVVFAVVLGAFAFDLVHRTPAALAGGILVVIAGAIGQEEAIEAVHWETLGLLVGMMILVGILKDSGIFGYLAIKSAQAAKGRPGLVLIYLASITAVLSAFLDNVTTVLLMFPVTLVIAHPGGGPDPVPDSGGVGFEYRRDRHARRGSTQHHHWDGGRGVDVHGLHR